jgi:hypothetical protein
MELIPQWRQAWKYAVVIGSALLAIFASLQAALPALQQYLPPRLFAGITAVCAVVIIIARVIKQTIVVPPEVKSEMVETAKATPVQPVEEKL